MTGNYEDREGRAVEGRAGLRYLVERRAVAMPLMVKRTWTPGRMT